MSKVRLCWECPCRGQAEGDEGDEGACQLGVAQADGSVRRTEGTKSTYEVYSAVCDAVLIFKGVDRIPPLIEVEIIPPERWKPPPGQSPLLQSWDRKLQEKAQLPDIFEKIQDAYASMHPRVPDAIYIQMKQETQ